MVWPPVVPSMRNKVPASVVAPRSIFDGSLTGPCGQTIKENKMDLLLCPEIETNEESHAASQESRGSGRTSSAQVGAQPIAAAPRRAAPPPPPPSAREVPLPEVLAKAPEGTNPTRRLREKVQTLDPSGAHPEASIISAVSASDNVVNAALATPIMPQEPPPKAEVLLTTRDSGAQEPQRTEVVGSPQRRRKLAVKVVEPLTPATPAKAARVEEAEELCADGTPPRRSGRLRTPVPYEALTPIKTARAARAIPSTPGKRASMKGSKPDASTVLAKDSGKSAKAKQTAQANIRKQRRKVLSGPLKLSFASPWRELVLAQVAIEDLRPALGLSSRPQRKRIRPLEDWRLERRIYHRAPDSVTPSIAAVERNLAPREPWESLRPLHTRCALQAPIKTEHSATIKTLEGKGISTWTVCLQAAGSHGGTVRLSFKAGTNALLHALNGEVRFALEGSKEVRLPSGDVAQVKAKNTAFTVLVAPLTDSAIVKVVEVSVRP